MATKTKVNKSQAVREALKASPEKMPAQIAEELTKAGIKVSAGMVSTIKSKAKGKRRGRPKGSKNGQAKMTTNGQAKTTNGEASGFGSAVVFIQQVGGIAQARKLIETLANLK